MRQFCDANILMGPMGWLARRLAKIARGETEPRLGITQLPHLEARQRGRAREVCLGYWESAVGDVDYELATCCAVTIGDEPRTGDH
jgi:hypothetical protein